MPIATNTSSHSFQSSSIISTIQHIHLSYLFLIIAPERRPILAWLRWRFLRQQPGMFSHSLPSTPWGFFFLAFWDHLCWDNFPLKLGWTRQQHRGRKEEAVNEGGKYPDSPRSKLSRGRTLLDHAGVKMVKTGGACSVPGVLFVAECAYSWKFWHGNNYNFDAVQRSKRMNEIVKRHKLKNYRRELAVIFFWWTWPAKLKPQLDKSIDIGLIQWEGNLLRRSLTLKIRIWRGSVRARFGHIIHHPITPVTLAPLGTFIILAVSWPIRMCILSRRMLLEL